MVRHINKSEFESEIINGKGIVLVDFFATWCPPCKMLAPVLDEIANSRAEFKIYKVDVDQNPEISTKYNIDVVPTLLLFKDGKVVKTSTGYIDKDKVLDMITSHM